MEKTGKVDGFSKYALRHSNEFDASCEGCLAVTGNFLCDLGKTTQAILFDGMVIGLRPIIECNKVLTMDGYIIEHLKRM